MKRLALVLALTATGAVAQQTPGFQAAVAAMRIQIQPCWVIDVDSGQSETIVTLGFAMNPDGTVQPDSITLVNAEGPDTEGAMHSARRALLRCQGEGYPLPLTDFEAWKQIEIKFDPRSPLGDET
ncbi:cell envelope integrity protein TolA [Ponticoccus alexandrii]|uniref:Energy transducer TonB n=1 Tax=Ponticoccus alexandrii TaxID=1943633 RepID=A0ABX7FD97_9RHOB|nr:cell envelope integrity protein TolA [Ponticoccus alexandrii]ETA50528.1 hypothetical protein P279_18985 [Rhodobacteraceae bacterium PD-2]QRF67554.1 hypothetical protein GQA70_15285 [Ponticoccus alexandrii]